MEKRTTKKKDIVKEEKQEEKERAKSGTKSHTDILEKQVRVIVLIIIGLIIIIAVVIILRQNSYSFKYEGISYKKVSQGNILLYRATVPTYDEYGNAQGQITIDFRNDPRTLGDVKINISDGIYFSNEQKNYISYNITSCPDNSLAGANLGFFLNYFKIDYKAGLDDPDYKNANITNIPYVNCKTKPFSTVIHISNGNETSISKVSANCYELKFSNCEILKVTERFELEMLKQYTQRHTSSN